jgi:hypothetical protein
MKQKLIIITLMLLIAASGFYAGYMARLRAYDQVYENGRTSAFQEVSLCTLDAAHKELCAIPCSTDEDCLAKNGQTDH